MKKTMIASLLVFLAVHAHAQKLDSKDVPAGAKNNLAKKYSGKNANWEKEDDKYEASFKQKGEEVSVLFDAAGNILETETEINKKDLPSAILATLKKDYSEYEIEEAAKIDANGAITYEVEVEIGEQTFDLIFDVEGKLLKKELKQQEDKD
ncbi:MAG: PepSY-like domain-containing protein [Flammeovirgaceae bacterium]|nr:MAG: PepSY-like domain-containing protein [Flammeovirgaceae bacterium]